MDLRVRPISDCRCSDQTKGEREDMSKVARYIAAAIERSGKLQVDISRAAGFDKPNVVTMIKQGKTKLPLERVGVMAQALGVDRFELLDLVMGEYHPELWVTIRSTLRVTPSAKWADLESRRPPPDTGVNPK